MQEQTEEIVRLVMEQWVTMSNASDAAGVASLFLENACCVTRLGVFLRGRTEIESGHDRTFRRVKLTGREFSVLSAAKAGPDTITFVWKGIVAVSGGEYAGDQMSLYGGTLQRDSGSWGISLLQCTSAAA